MPELQHHETVETVDTPVSVSHIVHTIRAYAPAILLSWAAVAIGVLLVTLLAYLLSPSQRITSQQFRLEFQGASGGTYPNGLKFSPAEIVSTPILLQIFNDNHMERFTSFTEFSRSIFVLESNAEYEKLAADYQARLADPKLSPVDRERIQREWEGKAASISKNDFSINYLRTSKNANVPESLVRKVLSDILNAWASYAIREQHVMNYRISVLSPEVITAPAGANGDFIIDLQVLRSKMSRVLENINALHDTPGAELVRTKQEKMSLEEIRLRIEEIVRYRIEPLISTIRSSGLIANSAATVRFLEAQLAYDQRVLKARQDYADAYRQSLAVYTIPEQATSAENSGSTPATADKPRTAAGETVMPQLSDTFLDRLVTFASRSSDMPFRQKMIDDYRKAALETIPSQMAVAYDQEVLAMVRTAPAGAATGAHAEEVRNEIAATRAEVRTLVSKVNEIYEEVSRNLNPSTELFSLTSPPATRTERARSLPRLGLYGALALFGALPIIIALCLLHARIREEEATEQLEVATT